MILTDEQLKELEGIYNLSRSKDAESKKLAKSLIKTISFLDLNNSSIGVSWISHDCYIDHYGPTDMFRSLSDIPIVVLLYLLTRDDKYLKSSRYSKHHEKFWGKKREFIMHSGTVYFIDHIYKYVNIEDIIKSNYEK